MQNITLKQNITGLQHIGIPVSDLQTTTAYYQRLGFELIFDKVFDDNGSQGHACFLRHGDLVLEVYQCATPAGRAGAVDHIALNVQDIEKAYQDINDMGLNNTGDTIHFLPFFAHGVKFFTIEGPDAEKVEFNQFLQA